MPEKNIKLL